MNLWADLGSDAAWDVAERTDASGWSRPDGLLRYGAAIALVAAAGAALWTIRLWFEPGSGLLVLSVIAAAWYGGKGPALFATVLAAITAECVAPVKHPAMGLRIAVRLIVYAVAGLSVHFLAAAQRKTHELLETRVKERTEALNTSNQRLYAEIERRGDVEAALRESEQLHRAVLEQAHDGIYLVDTDSNRVTQCNSAIAKLLGYDPAELTGKSVYDLVAHAPAHLDQRLLAVSTDTGYFVSERSYRRKDGSLVDVEASANLLYLGGHRALCTIVRDITERKIAEAKILRYQRQLRKLAAELTVAEERERRRLARELHDGIAQILAVSHMKLESIPSAGTDVDAAISHVSGLIEQVIGLTRSLTFELSPPLLYEHGLESAISWLCKCLQSQHGIDIAFEDVNVSTKPLREEARIILFQGVRELLINVVKHAKASKATVSLRETDDSIVVRVCDDGAGFDCDRFAATDNPHGFGLFSIRERLQHLGGGIGLESQPGHGTKATLEVPINAAGNIAEERPLVCHQCLDDCHQCTHEQTERFRRS